MDYKNQQLEYPTYEQFIFPMKAQADIVINNNHRLDGALDLIGLFLKEKVEKAKGLSI